MLLGNAPQIRFGNLIEIGSLIIYLFSILTEISCQTQLLCQNKKVSNTQSPHIVFPENVVIFAEKDEFDKLKPSSPKTAKR